VTRIGAATIDPTAHIAQTAVIGSQFRRLLDGRQVQVDRDTVIAARAWIGEFTVIGRGVRIGADALVEDYASIQANSEIGKRVVVASRAWVGLGVRVGDDSVIKGHVGDSARIGTGCRIAGDLIHRQIDPSGGWDDPASEEPSPVVKDNAFVGWRAVIVGGINIGEGAYVCAGALVTRDVPAGYVACGRNEIMPPSEWPGALGKSPFFGGAAARPARGGGGGAA
jgi:UDP-3-O-[3-hydroxymyristoyl] glucosamine N-acyltransferase